MRNVWFINRALCVTDVFRNYQELLCNFKVGKWLGLDVMIAIDTRIPFYQILVSVNNVQNIKMNSNKKEKKDNRNNRDKRELQNRENKMTDQK